MKEVRKRGPSTLTELKAMGVANVWGGERLGGERLDNNLPSDANSSLPLRPGQADTDICLETTVHKWADVCRWVGGVACISHVR